MGVVAINGCENRSTDESLQNNKAACVLEGTWRSEFPFLSTTTNAMRFLEP